MILLDIILDFGRLALYTLAVLVAGIILWRIGVMVQRQKSEPKRGKYFNNKFKDHWKNKK